MIPLNELRLGILILHDKDQREIRINHVSDIVMIGQNNHKYVGIEITKEWFLKLGFIEIENEYDTTYEIEIKDGYKLESVKSLTLTGFLIREINNVTGDELFFLPNEYKYVHELQNLYFSLSGKELTIDVS